MRDFGIGASQLGNFSAVYFYAYIAMQIPTGVLVDSWGARRLLIGGSLAAAAGTCLFGLTTSYALASVGRLIVGGATAVGWVVTLKLATHWFPRQRFAMLSGLGLMMGNIGALVAQVPLRLLVEQFGWRAVALGSAGVVLAVGGAAWALVTNDPIEKGFRSYAPAELQRTPSDDRPAGSRVPGDLHLSQHLADLLRAGRIRRRDAVVHRTVGAVVPPSAFRAGLDRRVSRLLGDDCLLGDRQPDRRLPVRPDRAPQADLSRRRADRGGRLVGALSHAAAAAGLHGGRGHHQLRVRRGGHRIRVREGVGADSAAWHHLRRRQRREHAGPDHPAARDRTRRWISIGSGR